MVIRLDWRNPGKWEIRYCVSAPLIGSKKYKTYRVDDYKAYKTDAIHLTPLKGLGGEMVDLSNPDTYMDLDAEEVGVLVGLEQKTLTSTLQKIFDPTDTNSFNFWVNTEMRRLQGADQDAAENYQYYKSEEDKAAGKYEQITDKGTKYNQNESDGEGTLSEGKSRYEAGRALEERGWYAKPICPHGPNAMQVNQMVATVVATCFGGPVAGALVSFACSAMNTAIMVNDGMMSWRQGMVQVGVSAVASLAGGAAGMAVQGAVMAAQGATIATQTMMQAAISSGATMAAQTAASGVVNQLGSGIQWDENGFGYDKDALKDKNAWGRIAVNSAVSFAGGFAGGMLSTGDYGQIQASLAKGAINTTGNMVNNKFFTNKDQKQDWGSIIQTGAVNTAVGFANNGISEKMGANNPITAMTTNFVSQLVGRATNTGGEIDWGAVSSAGSMDVMDVVGMARQAFTYLGRDSQRGETQSNSVPTEDPMRQKEDATNAAGYGINKQNETMNEIAQSIQGMWDNGGRDLRGMVAANSDLTTVLSDPSNPLYGTYAAAIKSNAPLDIFNKGGYSKLSENEYTSMLQSVGAGDVNLNIDMNMAQQQLQQAGENSGGFLNTISTGFEKLGNFFTGKGFVTDADYNLKQFESNSVNNVTQNMGVSLWPSYEGGTLALDVWRETVKPQPTNLLGQVISKSGNNLPEGTADKPHERYDEDGDPIGDVDSQEDSGKEWAKATGIDLAKTLLNAGVLGSSLDSLKDQYWDNLSTGEKIMMGVTGGGLEAAILNAAYGLGSDTIPFWAGPARGSMKFDDGNFESVQADFKVGDYSGSGTYDKYGNGSGNLTYDIDTGVLNFSGGVAGKDGSGNSGNKYFGMQYDYNFPFANGTMTVQPGFVILNQELFPSFGIQYQATFNKEWDFTAGGSSRKNPATGKRDNSAFWLFSKRINWGGY